MPVYMGTLSDQMFTIMYMYGLYVKQILCDCTVYFNMILKFLASLNFTELQRHKWSLRTFLFEIEQVLRGKYVFTFGDHGGVIIAVPYRRYTKTLR